jgi:hypothetical protein
MQGDAATKSGRAEESMMRMLMLAMLALTAVGAGTMTYSAPAAAFDYPWCAQGRGVGIPGDCMYQTYAQCMASASGRNLYCNVNPRVAFGQLPEPRRRRTHRNYYND